MKICKRCLVKKSNKSFTVNNARMDNLEDRCRDCISEIRRNNYDPVKAKKQWRKNKYSTPEYAEDRRLRAAYGITKKVRDYMARQINYLCEICNERISLVVDHDHITGLVRGLLCARCNRGLGHFDDNVELLTKAVEYIRLKTEQNNTEFAG